MIIEKCYRCKNPFVFEKKDFRQRRVIKTWWTWWTLEHKTVKICNDCSEKEAVKICKYFEKKAVKKHNHRAEYLTRKKYGYIGLALREDYLTNKKNK